MIQSEIDKKQYDSMVSRLEYIGSEVSPITITMSLFLILINRNVPLVSYGKSSSCYWHRCKWMDHSITS